MPIVRIKVCDASSQPLVGMSVALSDCGDLQTNGDGLVQFLAGESVPAKLAIGGTVVWTGNLGELTRNELFTQSGSNYTRSQVA